MRVALGVVVWVLVAFSIAQIVVLLRVNTGYTESTFLRWYVCAWRCALRGHRLVVTQRWPLIHERKDTCVVCGRVRFVTEEATP